MQCKQCTSTSAITVNGLCAECESAILLDMHRQLRARPMSIHSRAKQERKARLAAQHAIGVARLPSTTQTS